MVNSEQVDLYRVGASAVQRGASHKLGQVVQHLAWADARRPAVLLDRGQVVLLERGEALPLKLPPASTWRLPRPKEQMDLVEVKGFPGGKDRLLRDAAGGLWVSHCAWAYEGDGDPCARWVHARLRPSALVSRKLPEAAPAHEPPDGEPPRGYSVKLHNPAEGPAVVSCKSPAGQQRQEYPGHSCSISVSAAWLGPGGKQLLLTLELDCGEGESSSYQLVDDCDLKAALEIDMVAWGPGMLWSHPQSREDRGGWVIRRGAQELGWVAGDGPVWFNR